MSKDNDLFGLDDVFESDGEAGGHVQTAVGVAIRLLLAVTTFGFFYLYAGNLFGWLAGPDYSPYISAVVGAFTIDYMAYHWDSLRRKGSTTESQMSVAGTMTIVNLSLSVVVTVVFFILGTDFVTITNLDGSLNTVGFVVNILGLMVGVIALAGNGIAWAYFEAQDISAKEAIARTKVRIAQFKGQTKINEKRTRLQIESTIAGIDEQIGQLTSDAGAQATSRYVEQFATAPHPPAPFDAPQVGKKQMAADGNKTAVMAEPVKGSTIYNAIQNDDGTMTVVSEESEPYAPVSKMNGLSETPSGTDSDGVPIYGNIPITEMDWDMYYLAKSDGRGGWIATHIFGSYEGVSVLMREKTNGIWACLNHNNNVIGDVYDTTPK